MAGGKAGFHNESILGEKSGLNSGLKVKREVGARLTGELERLKKMVGMGFEVSVRWLSGKVRYKNGKQLLEEVSGDTIIIYTEDSAEAMHLLAHGFAEWLLNQHTKRYRLLINKLIEVYEQIQYEEKEKIVQALTKLMEKHKYHIVHT